MNQHEDSLEAELAAWQPAPVSEKLKQRIGQDVSRIVPFRRRAWLLAGTLAACVLMVLLLRTKENDRASLLPTASIVSEKATEPFDQLPSLQVYIRALNQSADALDTMLDRHGTTGIMTSSTPGILQAFIPYPSSFTN